MPSQTPSIPNSNTNTNPSSPSSSRAASIRSQTAQQHAPINPSGLRESHTIFQSPKGRMDASETNGSSSPSSNAHVEGNNVQPKNGSTSKAPQYPHVSGDVDDPDAADARMSLLGNTKSKASDSATENTSLLRKPWEFITGHAHPGPCDHGTFSPQPTSRAASFIGREGLNGFGGAYPGGSNSPRGVFDSTTGNAKRMTTTEWLAQSHGITNTRAMYLSYYIPFFAWIRQYKWSYFKGDLIAALTMASFYLPMSLSFASNLAHIPPINGLYSFVFNPLIYALMGSCPQMVVGPEAAGSLLVGTIVKDSVEKGHTGDDDDAMNARIAGVVTGMAGAAILIAGLTRLGFLDSVLSRPFLRGFISAIGFVIVVDQLIPEMGLGKLADASGNVGHGSSIDKLEFIFKHIRDVHGLTFAVAGGSFLTIMLFRECKKRLQPRYPGVAYFPDRFIVVVGSAILCWAFAWEKQGLEILGEIKSSAGRNPFPFHWPFRTSHMTHVREAMSTSFLIALLGFFESSVAAKGIGGGEGKGGDGIQGIALSPNRELVALGVANLVGGCFSALPAFGGYGRSKVNASTGGKTPMSSIFLSIITVICILFLLPYFYYLPKAVLSSMITVVAWSLIEEAPHDIHFFLKIRGYTELGLMGIIFAATIFYSLNLGIAIGIGLSLLSVIKHSTRPRIQILGRIPGTNRFENAEDNPDKLEFIEGCLIVKIPEPLTFANTGDLKNRLRRLELYGTTSAHPALPRVRSEEHNKNVIFDVHGVTGLDGSGTQVLTEIVKSYRERGVNVYFSRLPVEGSHIWQSFERSGILDACGGKSHFVGDVNEALTMMEADSAGGYENMAGDGGGR